MRYLRSFLFWLFIGLPFLPSLLKAGLEETPAGARASGMAEAFVAVANDASAIHYNPAGLAAISHMEMATQFGQFLNGLTDGSAIESSALGVVAPLKKGRWGTMGLAYHNFKGSRFFNDRLLSLSYGKTLNDRWSWGATVKQFRRDYEPDPYTANALNNAGVASGQADPLFAKAGFGKSITGLDVGAMYRFGPSDKYSAGGAVANLNQPGLSLGTKEEKAPLMVRGGLAVKTSWALLSVELRRAKRLHSGTDTETAVGVEKRFLLTGLGAVSLRGGYGGGSRQFEVITAGLSIEFFKAQLDYGFQLPLGSLSEASGIHRLAFSIKFAPSASAPPPASPRMETRVTPSPAPTRGYDADRSYYLTRKAEGASIYERLQLLQDLHARYGESGIDLSWLAKELSSL